MTLRFSHTPPNFPTAFMLAPIAGGIGASAVAVLWWVAIAVPGGMGFEGVTAVATLAGLYAAVISLVYTSVVGSVIAVVVLRFRRVPSRAFVIICGLSLGFLPFAAFTFLVSDGSEQLLEYALIPGIALAASVASAWAFWALGLKGRAH